MRLDQTLRRYIFACQAVFLAGILFSTQAAIAGTPVKLLINTSHALENARGAVIDAGMSLSFDVSVSSTSTDNGSKFLPPDKIFTEALALRAGIISSSFSGWNSYNDLLWYQKYADNGLVHVFAYEPRRPQPRNAPPPAAFVTVNKIGGLTGDGIEFGVPNGYMHGKGQSTTPSGVTAQLAGLMACLKRSHPDWNWFDIKAALRATAANFATGYDPQGYGYGTIDYHMANRQNEASSLPLFAPAAAVLPQKNNRLTFQINSFRQSRRMTDVLFKFSSHPGVKLKELTLAEINAMGGEYLYSSYLRQPANRYSYPVTRAETAYFVWLTMDARGMYSRIEQYSVIGPVRLKLQPSSSPLQL